MASAAKLSVDKTLDRVIGLFSARPLHGIRGRPRQYVSDILRSSLVLAVAALDASWLTASPERGRVPSSGGDSAPPSSLLRDLGE